MITLTITFKGTDHQVVLAYKTPAAVQTALDAMASGMVEDDYGQSVNFHPTDVINSVETDLEKHWKYRTLLQGIKLRAEADFNLLVEQDPTLKFLRSNSDIKFGAR